MDKPLLKFTNRGLVGYRIYHKLSNGQVAMFGVYVEKFDFTRELGKGVKGTDYEVFACVADSQRECREWANDKKKAYRKMHRKSTGKNTGLEALILFYKDLKDLKSKIEKYGGEYDSIAVRGSDERRTKAYRRIKKLGFEELEYDGKIKYYWMK